MPLAVDASSPIRFSGTPATNTAITSASFTPPAGAMLVVAVNCDSNTSPGTSNPVLVVTDSRGLTWTTGPERKESDSGGNEGYAGLFTSSTTTNAAYTVSVKQTTSPDGSTKRLSAKVYVVTGQAASPVGNQAEGSSATNDLTASGLTTAAANSLTFYAATDWNELGTPTSSDLTIDAADYAGAISVVSGYKAVAAAGATTADLNAGGTAAAAWNWVGLEIKAGGGGTAYSQTINDSLGATDGVTRTVAFSRTLSDSLGATDAVSRTVAFVRSLSDSLGATDAATPRIGYGRTVNDSLGATDSVSTLKAILRTINDSLGATDSTTRAAQFLRTVADALGATDSATPASAFARTVNDSLGATDSLSSLRAIIKTINDSLGVTDSIFAARALLRTISDTVGASDVAAHASALLRTINDGMGVSDAITKAQAYLRTLNESVGATDQATIGAAGQLAAAIFLLLNASQYP